MLPNVNDATRQKLQRKLLLSFLFAIHIAKSGNISGFSHYKYVLPEIFLNTQFHSFII